MEERKGVVEGAWVRRVVCCTIVKRESGTINSKINGTP